MANILIFEDDIDLATQWSKALSVRDHNVQLAADVSEAKSIIKNSEFNLVIVDFFIRESQGISKEGGLTLISHLRITPLTEGRAWSKTVPILAVTGSSPINGGFDALKSAEALGSTMVCVNPSTSTTWFTGPRKSCDPV